MADHRLHHRLGDRGGETAAGDLVAFDAGVLDEDCHGDLRVVGGRERDEPGVRRTFLRALGGTCLAGHLDPRDLCRSGGARVDGLDHHLGQVPGDGRADRLTAERLRVGLVEHVEIRRTHLVDQIGLHHRSTVGDPGGDHRHLQRGGRNVELPDGRQRGLWWVRVLREATRDLPVQVVEVLLAEAELLGLLLQDVGAEVHPEETEGHVAGDLQRLGQRDLLAAAVAAPVVDQIGVGLRQVEPGAAGDGRPRRVLTTGQGRCGGDQLEGRAGWVDLLDSAVEQRPGRVAVELVVRLLDRRKLVAREPVGVVGRRGDHREDGAGRRVQRDDAAFDVRAERAQTVVRRVLCTRVDGQADTAALRLGVTDQVDHPVHEQTRIAAGEDLVLGELHGSASVGVGVVPGEVGVLGALGVAALVLELVIDGCAPRDGLAVDQDRPALTGELGVADPLVVVAGVQLVGAEVLEVGRVHEQRHEQRHADDRHGPDRLVHRNLTT